MKDFALRELLFIFTLKWLAFYVSLRLLHDLTTISNGSFSIIEDRKVWHRDLVRK
jgi:hypothetical protein